MRGVRRPARRPPRWAYDVVRATYRLPAWVKHVWRIVAEFDAVAGCWASRALLARLVGIPLDRCVAGIEYLERVGLVISTTHHGRTTLFVTLPSDFPTDAKLGRDAKLALAEDLDRRLRDGPAPPSTKTQDDGQAPSIQTRSLSHKTPGESLTAVPLDTVPLLTAVQNDVARATRAESPKPTQSPPPQHRDAATLDQATVLTQKLAAKRARIAEGRRREVPTPIGEQLVAGPHAPAEPHPDETARTKSLAGG